MPYSDVVNALTNDSESDWSRNHVSFYGFFLHTSPGTSPFKSSSYFRNVYAIYRRYSHYIRLMHLFFFGDSCDEICLQSCFIRISWCVLETRLLAREIVIIALPFMELITYSMEVIKHAHKRDFIARLFKPLDYRHTDSLVADFFFYSFLRNWPGVLLCYSNLHHQIPLSYFSIISIVLYTHIALSEAPMLQDLQCDLHLRFSHFSLFWVLRWIEIDTTYVAHTHTHTHTHTLSELFV